MDYQITQMDHPHMRTVAALRLQRKHPRLKFTIIALRLIVCSYKSNILKSYHTLIILGGICAAGIPVFTCASNSSETRSELVTDNLSLNVTQTAN